MLSRFPLTFSPTDHINIIASQLLNDTFIKLYWIKKLTKTKISSENCLSMVLLIPFFSGHMFINDCSPIKHYDSHQMSTSDYYSSIIQQLWFISKVQLFLEFKIKNRESMYETCEWSSAAKEQWAVANVRISYKQKNEKKKTTVRYHLLCCILACSIAMSPASQPASHLIHTCIVMSSFKGFFSFSFASISHIFCVCCILSIIRRKRYDMRYKKKENTIAMCSASKMHCHWATERRTAVPSTVTTTTKLNDTYTNTYTERGMKKAMSNKQTTE